MRLSIALFSLVAFTKAGTIPEENEDFCTGIEVNGSYHEKEVLKEDIDRPYLLTVDYSANTVYFSYSLTQEDDNFRTVYINLNTRESGEIRDVPNGFAQTVDQKNHDVYIGGSNGIYKYDYKSKTSEFFGAKGVDIWMVYYKDQLYYSEFPAQFLYTLTNGESTRYKFLEDTKVDHFIIDNENDIFFTNDSGLYKQEKESKDAELYETKISVRGLATDINGNPYACLNDGIYVINKIDNKLDKIVAIEDAFGLAFDNENNIVYSDATQLVRLKPSKEQCNLKKE